MYGWLYFENIDCAENIWKSGTLEKIGRGYLYTNLLNKFYKDTVKMPAGYFLEGYVLNKQELMNGIGKGLWEDSFVELSRQADFPTMLRGSFAGLCMKDTEQIFFTDHTGSKSLYYYMADGRLIVSTRLNWIVTLLRYNHIPYTYNELAARYMLTYGFMIDDSSFILEIHRVLPGCRLVVSEEGYVCEQYYMPTFDHMEDITEEQAVDKIDTAFRRAVQREFEKDREYGYRHLVDLSGGLDSRMVSWVAHDLGFRDQVNFTYCKADYLDYKISSRIARDLKHEYYYKQLDDCIWLYDIDEILALNNGEAAYDSITGGKAFLSVLRNDLFGMEHTGMLGDVIISCYAGSEDVACGKPFYGANACSDRLSFTFDNSILEHYENQEIFTLYTRGFLGMLATYAIRQEYFEVASPFLDVDFLDVCCSIPVRYRAHHYIYLKWLSERYSEATGYGWEKWAGVQPKKELWLLRDATFAKRRLKRMAGQFLGHKFSDNMNPVDYWYDRDPEVQIFLQKYYEDAIGASCISNGLRADIRLLFEQGNVTEKAQALTVLGMGKLYFGMNSNG